MQIRRMRLASAVVAVSLLATACGSDDPATDGEDTTQGTDGPTASGDTDTLVVGVLEKPSGIGLWQVMMMPFNPRRMPLRA